MRRPYPLAGFTRLSFVTLLLASACFCLNPALADQKTNPEPVRTTLPAGASTHASKIMEAPIMSPEERNALYIQWGLVIVGGLIAITGVVVWVFLLTRKEAEENEEREEENAYTVPTPPPASDEVKPEATASSDSPATAETTGTADAAASTANKTES
jgi:hypothetical protein